MPKKYLPYYIGQEIPEAGLVIVSIVVLNASEAKSYYEIKYTCCGRIATLSREQIEKRCRSLRKKKQTDPNAVLLCLNCTRKKQAEKAWADDGLNKKRLRHHSKLVRDTENLLISLPTWPVPGI